MARSRKSRRRQLKASHQKNWLTGRHAVTEVLQAGRWPVDELLISEDLADQELELIRTLGSDSGVSVQIADSDRISELCHSDHHQGYAARMGIYPYESAEFLSDRVKELSDQDGPPPLIVICDRIQDTFNFGAILRCCDAVHAAAVVIGRTGQAAVTPQVARSSAGAVNHVSVVLDDETEAVVQNLADAGFAVVAASEKSETTVWDTDLNRPTALIIGSEANGIRPELLERCTHHVCLPMLGQGESRNAAVAAGILLYEIRRQQQ